MSYYNQPSQNAGYAPQGANPGYGWNPQQNQQNQQNPSTGTYYQSVPAFQSGGGYMDPESATGLKADVNFDDRTIRAGFIRKVFSLVCIMLAVVAVMSAIPFIHRETMTFIQANLGLYYLSYGTFFVVYLVLMCCENVRRSFPANLICTAILTLSIGYMTMMICSVYGIEAVLLTLIITTVCCAGIILFSMQTKYDLTSMMGFMFIISMVLLVFGLVAIVAAMAFHVRWMMTVYSGLAALMFMVYLAIDIQMIMGGRKYEISPEDHIFAAIQVFIDIIYIFWLILTLIGGSSNNNSRS